jgi:hypothetical protein
VVWEEQLLFVVTTQKAAKRIMRVLLLLLCVRNLISRGIKAKSCGIELN